MRKYNRKYVPIVCTGCGIEMLVRSDNANKHLGMCMKCLTLKRWKDPEYAKKCSDAHIGHKHSEETLKKQSDVKKGITPKNITSLHDMHRMPKGIASMRSIYRSYILGAKERGYVFELTQDEFHNLTSQNCYYCGKEPETIAKPNPQINGVYVYNGIDRVDNTIGYIISNCVPCCKHCNTSKGTKTLQEFTEYISRISLKLTR